MKTTLPIEIITLEDESYHIIVEVKFHHKLKGILIIDTGASKTIFDKDLADKLHVKLKKITDQKSSGINAMIPEAFQGELKKIRLGKLTLENQPYFFMDLSHINQLYQNYSSVQITGLLGSDFLVKYKAVINYSKKTLTLRINNV